MGLTIKSLVYFYFVMFLGNILLFLKVFYEEMDTEKYKTQDSHKDVGFWGPVTASIDWCESNYVVTFFVAEFWNALSSLHFVILSVWTLWGCRKIHLDMRFKVGNFFLMLTGIGSMLFHGTLTREMQLADEVPLTYMVLAFFYITVCVTDSYKTAFCLALYASIQTVCMFLHISNIVFQFPIFLCVLAIVAYHFRLFFTENEILDNTSRNLFLMSIFFMLVGTYCWPLERLFCKQLQSFQLHSWWHVSTGTAIHLFMQAWVGIRIRMETGGRSKLVMVGGIIPITMPSEKHV